MFRAEHPSIFITSHQMQRLPRNLHLVATWRSPDNAIRKKRNTTRLQCCACQAKWWWTRPKCCACHPNCNASSENAAPATQNEFRHVTKHVWMSRSATPTTRNESTRRVQPPKVTPFGELTIGTAIPGSRGRLRTVADGCERLGNVERTHPQPRDPPDWNGNPCYAFGKKGRNGTKKADVRHRRPVPSLSGKMFLLACRFRKQR